MSKTSSSTKIAAMTKGGRFLRDIKRELKEFTTVGTSFEQIEKKAQALIKACGCTPNFAMVPGYHWATCVMKNHQLCHGIPQDQVVDDGDLITIDVGLLCDGYHLDTSTSFVVGNSTPELTHFLEIGQKSLHKAIERAKVGASVFDISQAMQKVVEKEGFGAVYQLTGHGISKELHESPNIPCQAKRSDKRIKLYEGQTIAIEIMYTAGSPDLKLAEDGWTYETIDGSISAMFEETVLVTNKGPVVLT